MTNKTCLIIGFGRMGKLYYQILKTLNFKKIYIVSKPLDEKYITDKFFFKDIKDFKNQKIKVNLGVVATTADVHEFYVKELAKLKVKFIMVEKPISNSFESAKEMIKICKKNKSVLSVNHSSRFSAAIKLIKKIRDKKELGNLVSINVIGGNMGLAMNGVHFFDIFNYLTKSSIKHVTAEIDKKILINPRGKKFKDNSGLVIAKNDNKQFLYLNLSEQQGHGKTMSVVFRNGIIFIDSLTGKIYISKRFKKNFKLDTRFYSTKSNNKVFKLRDNIKESTKNSIQNLIKKKNYVTGAEGLEAIKAVIAALESSNQKGKSINLQSINKTKKFNWA